MSRIGIKPFANNTKSNENSISHFSPYSILHDLVEEYENSDDENTIQQLYKVTNKFSPLFEGFLDFLLIIGKFFSFLLAPFFIFSAAYNWCCEKRRRSLNKTIRQSLFQVISKLIELKLTDKNFKKLNEMTKLKYIYLLSSIDRHKTRKLLFLSPYVKLIPVVENAKDTDCENEINANFYQFEIFIQNLFTVSYMSNDQEKQSQIEKNLLTCYGGEMAKPLLKNIYTNLTLGEQLDNVGCEREAMPIYDSLYQINGAESALWNLDFLNLNAFNFSGEVLQNKDKEESNFKDKNKDKNNFQDKNKEENNFKDKNKDKDNFQDKNKEENNFKDKNKDKDNFQEQDKEEDNLQNKNKEEKEMIDFQISNNDESSKHNFLEGLDGFNFMNIGSCYEYYISNDGTACAAITFLSQTINLADAKRLGMVTPERAIELEKHNYDKIQPLIVCFRPLSCLRDAFTAARNIMDGVPIALKHSDKFTRFLIDKVNIINQEENANKPPFLPIFLGFSMGAMSATAMAIKYGYCSIVFNPLGIGKGVLNFIGEKKMKIANDDSHAHCYQSYFMKRDWVSDPSNNLVSKLFIAKPKIGQSYIINNIPDYINKLNAMMRHNLISILLTDWTCESISSRISHILSECKSFEQLCELKKKYIFFSNDPVSPTLTKTTNKDESLDKDAFLNDDNFVFKEKTLSDDPTLDKEKIINDEQISDNEKILNNNQVSDNEKTSNDKKTSDKEKTLNNEQMINNDSDDFFILNCMKQALFQNLAKILGYGTMIDPVNLRKAKSFLIQILDYQSKAYKEVFFPSFMNLVELMDINLF